MVAAMVRLWIAALALALLALAGTARAEPVLDLEEHALWTLINDYRQAHDLPPVGLNEQLTVAAEWMADDMAANDRYSHTDSLGRSARQRMTAFGYTKKTTTGEILAAGRDTAQEAFDAWKESPEHNAIMLGPFWAVGIAAFYDEASTHGWYWTVDFGGLGPAWLPSNTATPLSGIVLLPAATPEPLPIPTPMPAALPATGTAP